MWSNLPKMEDLVVGSQSFFIGFGGICDCLVIMDVMLSHAESIFAVAVDFLHDIWWCPPAPPFCLLVSRPHID
jgi:hypothetical protein